MYVSIPQLRDGSVPARVVIILIAAQTCRAPEAK